MCRDLIVRNHAGVDGADCHNVGWRSAQHFLGLLADLQDLAGVFIHSDNRRFTGNNSFPLLKKHGGSRAHVYRYVLLKYGHLYSRLLKAQHR